VAQDFVLDCKEEGSTEEKKEKRAVLPGLSPKIEKVEGDLIMV